MALVEVKFYKTIFGLQNTIFSYLFFTFPEPVEKEETDEYVLCKYEEGTEIEVVVQNHFEEVKEIDYDGKLFKYLLSYSFKYMELIKEASGKVEVFDKPVVNVKLTENCSFLGVFETLFNYLGE